MELGGQHLHTDSHLLDLLKADVAAWNDWKKKNVSVRVRFPGVDLRKRNLRGAQLDNVYLSEALLDESDLSGASLAGVDLHRASLRGTQLPKVTLQGVDLYQANCESSNLSHAYLREATLIQANFKDALLDNADLSLSHASEATFTNASARKARFHRAFMEGAIMVSMDCCGASFSWANLHGANFSLANLQQVSFDYAVLVSANFTEADLSGSSVYGTAVWNVNLSGAIQKNLWITPHNEPSIQVDNLEVAQFIYLLLNNTKIRQVIDTITSKVVLILGRFTPERKAILDAIRDELRKRDYLPVLFDFEKPSNRDITETVSTLAHMARFVIADLSDPRSIPHELAHVVPLLPSVPIMPLIVRPQTEYAMFEHFFGLKHVLKPFRYRDEAQLLSVLDTKVIAPAEKLAQRVAGQRRAGTR
jgi:uncharacterized protein YjbI with pentapeptide repeats